MLLIGSVVVVVAVVGFLVVQRILAHTKPIPEFPSLADTPDPSLTGTVAYYDMATGCVRIVDASGAASEDAYCFETAGDENGPQLLWRPDGRLEVTVFAWPEGGEPTGKWQRLIDLETGEVEEVPAADVPAEPSKSPDPAIGPNGEEVTWSSKSGKITVELTTDAGTRTLLEAEGPDPDYEIREEGLFLSPDGKWIVVDDTQRLLLITTDDPSTTRVLVDQPGGVGSYGSFAVRLFAVTDETLVEAGG